MRTSTYIYTNVHIHLHIFVQIGAATTSLLLLADETSTKTDRLYNGVAATGNVDVRALMQYLQTHSIDSLVHVHTFSHSMDAVCQHGSERARERESERARDQSRQLKSNMLQYIVAHCNTLHHSVSHGNAQQYTTTRCTYCTTLHHTATHCSTLQHTASHCNTLQHTATPDVSGKHTSSGQAQFGMPPPIKMDHPFHHSFENSPTSIGLIWKRAVKPHQIYNFRCRDVLLACMYRKGVLLCWALSYTCRSLLEPDPTTAPSIQRMSRRHIVRTHTQQGCSFVQS